MKIVPGKIFAQSTMNTMQTAEMRMQTVQPKTQFHAASILLPRCTCFSAVVLVVAFNVMASTSCFFFAKLL